MTRLKTYYILLFLAVSITFPAAYSYPADFGECVEWFRTSKIPAATNPSCVPECQKASESCYNYCQPLCTCIPWFDRQAISKDDKDCVVKCQKERTILTQEILCPTHCYGLCGKNLPKIIATNNPAPTTTESTDENADNSNIPSDEKNPHRKKEEATRECEDFLKILKIDNLDRDCMKKYEQVSYDLYGHNSSGKAYPMLYNDCSSQYDQLCRGYFVREKCFDWFKTTGLIPDSASSKCSGDCNNLVKKETQTQASKHIQIDNPLLSELATAVTEDFWKPCEDDECLSLCADNAHTIPGNCYSRFQEAWNSNIKSMWNPESDDAWGQLILNCDNMICGKSAAFLGSDYCPSYCNDLCSEFIRLFMINLESNPDVRSKVKDTIKTAVSSDPSAGNENEVDSIDKVISDALQEIANFVKDAYNFWVKDFIPHLMLGINPIIGAAVDIYEFLTGKNITTGEELSSTDRTLNFISLFLAPTPLSEYTALTNIKGLKDFHDRRSHKDFNPAP